jgi:hypothetical protein
MHLGYRFGRGHDGIYIPEQFKQGRAMPGIALEGAAKLISEERGF